MPSKQARERKRLSGGKGGFKDQWAKFVERGIARRGKGAPSGGKGRKGGNGKRKDGKGGKGAGDKSQGREPGNNDALSLMVSAMQRTASVKKAPTKFETHAEKIKYVKEIVAQRNAAREAGDWALSDTLRVQLRDELGVHVQDQKNGPSGWRFKDNAPKAAEQPAPKKRESSSHFGPCTPAGPQSQGSKRRKQAKSKRANKKV